MWSEKHKPKKLEDFIGNSALEFMRNWTGAPLILHGGPGTGKTLIAELTAADRGWDIVYIDDDNIENARNIAGTSTIFGGRKLIIIDSVDKIKDIKQVGELVSETKNPIILTTNDYASKRLATVKKKCQDLQLRRPMAASIAKHLAEVCRREGVEASKEVLEAIAKNSSGDFRSALNDFETIARGRGKITEKDLEILAERDEKSDIYRALSIIFGGRSIEEVVENTRDLEDDTKDVIWWVEENIPLLYKDNKSLNDAMHNISRADVFLGRIQNRQYWGFLRYAKPLMTAGVNVSRPEKISFTRYQYPSYFMSLGKSKGNTNMERGIAEKIKPTVHASVKVTRREYIPLLKTLIAQKKVPPEEIKEQFRLDDEEMEYLTS